MSDQLSKEAAFAAYRLACESVFRRLAERRGELPPSRFTDAWDAFVATQSDVRLFADLFNDFGLSEPFRKAESDLRLEIRQTNHARPLA